MSSDINEVTNEKLKREIKSLKEDCLQICNASQWEYNSVCRMNPDEANEKAQCYIKALQTEIQYTETSINVDEGIIINQFLSEIIEKTKQIEELTIFTQAAANDVQAKIDRTSPALDFILSILEADEQPRDFLTSLQKSLVFASKFSVSFSSSFNFILSRFSFTKALTLMQESQNAESNGYVPVTVENFRFVEMLIKLNLVKLNPYNKKEVKLDY
ncbi:hypothetical protein K1T71_001652 [Dendrolimus kikuchii]|uniref:Uncharacterized protein n=1 Tax=Dendrolimus kikuchii TaxID=765133 RepID=A0ACC1DEB5_9NEOP|nr:hypothetical protein K1T71_001652 [Dendrolimus kikuchii]